MQLSISYQEMRELLAQTKFGARVAIERLEDNAVIIQVTDPITASVRLDDFQVHGEEVSAQLNLNVLLRTAISAFLKKKNITQARLDGKRIYIQIPPEAREFGELQSLKITPAGVTVTGRIKKLPQT